MRRVSRSRRLRVLAAAVAMLAAAGICRFALGQQHAIIANGQSPHSRLRSVDLSDVSWTDGFWKQKFDLVKDVTIPKMWEYFNTDYADKGGHHWINFRIAAGLQEGPWKGRSWHDGDFYKWLEAVAHVYMVTKDPRLDQQMDEVIEIIGKAQQPDGYLSTQIILQKWPRFQDIHHQTNYPWDGEIRLQIEEVAAGKPFAIMLRIPEWATGATIRVNGQPAGVEVVAGRYAALRRAWSGGDVVELSLPMQVRLVRANPLAEELRGQVAVMRGPVLYCLESVDLPDGTDVMEVVLPADADLTPRFDADLLGGVVVLEGEAIHWENTGWREATWDAERLYEDASRPRLRPVSVRLIPYHAWLNRGPSQMTVWMPFALRDSS